jgi:hypothetical protein
VSYGTWVERASHQGWSCQYARFAAVDVEEELGNEMAVGRGQAQLGAYAMVCVLPALDVLVVIDKS